MKRTAKIIFILSILISVISCHSGDNASKPGNTKQPQNQTLVTLSEAQIKNAGIVTGPAAGR